MSGFEPRISGVESDRSANCATTTALKNLNLSNQEKKTFLVFVQQDVFFSRSKNRLRGEGGKTGENNFPQLSKTVFQKRLEPILEGLLGKRATNKNLATKNTGL